jgi:hypothetical protein
MEFEGWVGTYLRLANAAETDELLAALAAGAAHDRPRQSARTLAPDGPAMGGDPLLPRRDYH